MFLPFSERKALKNKQTVLSVKFLLHFRVFFFLFLFLRSSIKCVLLLCVTVNQARTPINVISQGGFWGGGRAGCPAYQRRENVSQGVQGWEPRWAFNLPRGSVTWRLRPQPQAAPWRRGTCLPGVRLSRCRLCVSHEASWVCAGG